MRSWRKTALFVALHLAAVNFLSSLGHAQSTAIRQRSDQSLHEGQPLADPEAFSGIWESPDGQGGAVGIQLKLQSEVGLQYCLQLTNA